MKLAWGRLRRPIQNNGVLVLTINKLDGRRVLLVLADKDMTDFRLDFARLGMENEHSRKIIMRLIGLACRKTGIETRGKRLSVEALMFSEGCYFLVTVKEKRRRYVRRRLGESCFEFETAADFLNAVEAAYRQGYCLAKNAAYERSGRYYLLFDYPAVPRSLRRVFGEFALCRQGPLFSAHIREHGNLVCPRNAVATIGRFLV